MPEIAPIRPDQVGEARRVIYTVAYTVFHEGPSLEEVIARYEHTWPLPDLDDVQGCYCDNGGVFLVMTDAGRIIGTGGIRRLEPRVCEIKRLWLLPDYHGQRLGYQMMLALLEQARARGYQTVRLETAPAYQPRAYAFYHRVGFHDIPRYGDDPDDVGMEMEL